MNFTARQLSAIDHGKRDRDMCVVAGPGSGKTAVLVERFRRLVCEAGISPSRILAITFTEKAAASMKAKLAEAFRGHPEDRRRLERAWVSTVHGFCMRLLRENAVFAGLDPEFRVLDEREASTLQIAAVRDAMDECYRERPEELRALMRALAGNDLAGALREIYEAARAAGMGLEAWDTATARPQPAFQDLLASIRELPAGWPPGWTVSQAGALEQVIEWGERHRDLGAQPISLAHFEALAGFSCNLNRFRRNNPIYNRMRDIRDLVPAVYRAALRDYYAPQRLTVGRVLVRFDDLYRARKRQLSALDYADLEEFAVSLLEQDREVRERVRAQFDQVLMDEFQDTNGLQSRLLELVRPPGCFYAVGDINQAIYGFRHADPDVFRKYRDEVAGAGTPLEELTENWRSRREILQAVAAITQGADGIEPRPLVAARQFAEKNEPSVEVIAAVHEDAAEALRVEAAWVASRILELAGGDFGNIAVLVRNSEVLPDFTAAFDDFGIPYLLSRGKGFYESPEIKDLVHLLRVLVNPRDEISTAAVLRSPLVEASDEALWRLKLAGNPGEALECASFNGLAGDDREKLERFREQLAGWRPERDYISCDRLLLRALDETAYPRPTGSRAAANVEKFLAIAREASTRLSLAAFVDELEIARASDPREAEAPPEDSANAVRVMTVHAAKGLEFPFVFLAALHKGIDTKLGVISFSPRIGLGVRWRNPLTGEDKDDTLQHAIREERQRREAEEANRLLYVALTRAEERLVLSFSGMKNWAATVQSGLGLHCDTPDNEARIQSVAAPGGESFEVLVRCAGAPPAKPPRPQTIWSRSAPARLARPELTDQYDSNATVTSVNLFANCPRRYYLERYLGWEGGAQPGSGSGGDAGEFGRQVHACLAGLAVECEEARKLASVFLRSSLGKRAARAARVEREYDFLLAIEDVVLRGQIDLWFEEAGELVLVDYKTDDVGPAEAAAHAQKYAVQLRLYARALRGITGRLPDKAYIYLLRPDVAAQISLPLPLFDDLEQIVRDFRQAQSRLQFLLNVGEHCWRCPYYRGLCPAVL